MFQSMVSFASEIYALMGFGRSILGPRSTETAKTQCLMDDSAGIKSWSLASGGTKANALDSSYLPWKTRL